MKKSIVVFLFGLFPILSFAQNCQQIYSDDFSNPSLWTHSGTTNTVSITGGVTQYANSIDGVEDRLYHQLPVTLSDNYWKAEFKFTITANNPSGNGVSATLFAATAGNLDFFSYDASQGNAPTNQDGIALFVYSQNIADNNINNWLFQVNSKKGTVQTVSPDISLSSSISTYYLRVERISPSMARLSVFTDPSFTTSMTGSPVTFSIDSTITGLNYVQQGNNTPGNTSRILVGAQSDNLNICNEQPIITPNCESILTDDFSNTSLWTHSGTNNNVSITGGACKYNNAVDGVEDRIYRQLPSTLSDNYWKTEFKFTITATNPSGNGVSATLFAATAGNLDFFSYDASQGNAPTNQDGIALFVYSQNIADNNINNWLFQVNSKKGTVQAASPDISLSSSISTYYLRMERISVGMARLSVFTDPSFNLSVPGSPVTFAIDPSITGLNYIQQGNNTPGNSSRILASAQSDDLNICNEQPIITPNCESILTDDFSNASLWTHSGTNNNVSITGGGCKYNNAVDGVEDRIYRQLPSTLSDNYWKTEFKFTITATNPSGNGVSATLFAATAGNLDFFSYDASQGNAPTNQDGIALFVYSQDIADNNINNWLFQVNSKKGTVQTVSPDISLSSSISTYYLRVERISPSMARLSVFTDPSFTTSMTGSPVTFSIDSTITGLNYVQQGNNTPGNTSRILVGAQSDNLNICSEEIMTATSSIQSLPASFKLYPNPSSDYIMLSWVNKKPSDIAIYSVDGKLLVQEHINTSSKQLNIPVNSLASGYYFVFIKDLMGGIERKSFIKN